MNNDEKVILNKVCGEKDINNIDVLEQAYYLSKNLSEKEKQVLRKAIRQEKIIIYLPIAIIAILVISIIFSLKCL